MTTRAYRRRPGVTLMEVLIATMILSIGMVAIMALFPIGAVNFARASNQDRSTTHGVSSDMMFRYYWKSAWEAHDPFTGAPTGSLCPDTETAFKTNREPMLLLLEAHPTYGPLSGNPLAPGTTTDPSFPVLVDPIGWQAKNANPSEQGFVGGNSALPCRITLWRAVSGYQDPNNPPNNGGGVWKGTRQVPKVVTPGFPHPYYSLDPTDRTPTGVGNPYPPDTRMAIRLTALLDDLTFDAGGEAAAPTGQLERAGRYSAAWLIQRPDNSKYGDVKVTVLVYAARSLSDVPSSETAFVAQATAGEKLIVVSLGGQAAPPLRRGGWIAFSHLVPTSAKGNRPTLDFYRVTGINNDTPDTLYVETETPIKSEGGAFAYNGSAIVFDNLLEVFDRGVVSASK